MNFIQSNVTEHPIVNLDLVASIRFVLNKTKTSYIISFLTQNGEEMKWQYLDSESFEKMKEKVIKEAEVKDLTSGG